MKKEDLKKVSAIIYVRSNAAEFGAIKKVRPYFLVKNYLKNDIKLVEQEAACRDYCLKEGIEVIGIYRDENTPGIGAEQKALGEALSYCTEHKGDVDALVVRSIDRISRSFQSYMEFMNSFFDLGVEIMSITGGNEYPDRFNECQALPLN